MSTTNLLCQHGSMSQEEMMFPLFVEQIGIRTLQDQIKTLNIQSISCNDKEEQCGCQIQEGDGQKGRIEFCDGSQYVGELEFGRAHGPGTLRFANGDCYMGAFKDNEIHGVGIYE